MPDQVKFLGTGIARMESGVRLADQGALGHAEPTDPRRQDILARQARAVFPDLTTGQPRF
jgi:hypothetical protein